MTLLRGLSFEDYQALPGVNWSSLKSLAVSPKLYRYALTAPRTETDAMRFGSAVHCAVLEPDAFPIRYELWDGGDRRGNAWKEFAAMHEDKVILREADYSRCLAVRDAVRAYGPAAALLTGQSEISAQWVDSATGIACKGRFDHVSAAGLTDLKTTTSIDAHDFEMTAAKLLYWGQGAMYRRGLEACDSEAFDTPVRIVAVESAEPFDVAVFRLSDDALRAGDALVSDLLYRLGECTARDEWPGRFDNEQSLTLPPWLLSDETADGWGGLA